MIFLSLLPAYVLAGRAFPVSDGWRVQRVLTAATPVAVLVLIVVFVGFGSEPGDPLFAVSGLLQRLLIAVAFGWMTVSACLLLRRPK